jgi:hypothetical protein
MHARTFQQPNNAHNAYHVALLRLPLVLLLVLLLLHVLFLLVSVLVALHRHDLLRSACKWYNVEPSLVATVVSY